MVSLNPCLPHMRWQRTHADSGVLTPIYSSFLCLLPRACAVAYPDYPPNYDRGVDLGETEFLGHFLSFNAAKAQHQGKGGPGSAFVFCVDELEGVQNYMKSHREKDDLPPQDIQRLHPKDPFSWENPEILEIMETVYALQVRVRMRHVCVYVRARVCVCVCVCV